MRYEGLCKNVTNGQTDVTDIGKAFYNLPTTALGRRREIKMLMNMDP